MQHVLLDLEFDRAFHEILRQRFDGILAMPLPDNMLAALSHLDDVPLPNERLAAVTPVRTDDR